MTAFLTRAGLTPADLAAFGSIILLAVLIISTTTT